MRIFMQQSFVTSKNKKKTKYFNTFHMNNNIFYR